jgi:hypothetical protein
LSSAIDLTGKLLRVATADCESAANYGQLGV